MSLPTQPAEWGYTGAEPRVWGAWLHEWLEETPPVTREGNDMALRALRDVRGDLDQVIDQLEVWQRQHDADLQRGRVRSGDDAVSGADERRMEARAIDDAIDEAAERQYRDTLEGRRNRFEDEPRGDRDLPGYDRRVFGGDELDGEGPVRPRRHADDG